MISRFSPEIVAGIDTDHLQHILQMLEVVFSHILLS